MRDWSNRIYTNLKNYINDTNINFMQGSTQELSKFPTVTFETMENHAVSYDLSQDKENAQTYTIEINVYTTGDGALNIGRELFCKINECFSLMKFKREYGITQITNVLNTNINRLVARYNRYIGSGDEIKKIEKGDNENG